MTDFTINEELLKKSQGRIMLVKYLSFEDLKWLANNTQHPVSVSSYEPGKVLLQFTSIEDAVGFRLSTNSLL